MAAYVIGIAGGSASGKSSIAAQLRERLAPLPVAVINQDRFFKPREELPLHPSPEGTTSWPDHNHPDSFDFPALRAALAAARNSAAQVVIIEGILTLFDEELRAMMNLKLYIQADADERIVRRIRRNLEWGTSLDDICDFYLDSVRYRHQEFNEPTKAFADFIIPGGRYEAEPRELMLIQLVAQIRAEVSEESLRK
jgi:uridine kinase